MKFTGKLFYEQTRLLQLNKYENIPILTVSDYVKFFP